MCKSNQAIKVIDAGAMTHEELASQLGGTTITFAKSDTFSLKLLGKEHAEVILENCNGKFILKDVEQ